MKEFPFDAVSDELPLGATLIEASAGTGKTHAIVTLILRLVAEREVALPRILGVTFTKAATSELRDKVLRRLRETLDALRSGARNELADRWRGPGIDAACEKRLAQALRQFDELQVFTIHSFCQRALQTQAFRSGERFDTEMQSDCAELREQAVTDFWRRHFYGTERMVACIGLTRDGLAGRWNAILKTIQSHPGAHVVQSAGAQKVGDALREVTAAYAAVREAWRRDGGDVERLLVESPALSRDKSKSAFAPVNWEKTSVLLADMRVRDQPIPACLGAIASIARSSVEKATKPKKEVPTHPIFELAEEFVVALARFNTAVDLSLCDGVLESLEKEKARRNLMDYADVISRMRRAVCGEAGGGLFREVIAGQYDAVLIDEFQDTDTDQAAIFEALFFSGNHRVYLIGDPKQAIYGFRGADIQAYLEARAKAGRIGTLTVNYRSEPALLESFNALYAVNADAFLNDGIKYHPVHAPDVPKKDFERLSDNAEPLVLRVIGEEGDKVDDIRDQVAAALVRDIHTLMAPGPVLGERPLRLQDITVLVRKKKQADFIGKALRRAGIPCVMTLDLSVFESGEAFALHAWMEAVREPLRPGVVQAAMATLFLGLQAGAVSEYGADAGARQRWDGLFARWRVLWSTQGIFAALRDAWEATDAAVRLAQSEQGERHITNFMHLFELLHRAEQSENHGMAALCGWLSDQRDEGVSGDDAALLRLESDSGSVRIATLHWSKGLEFPVVFLPFVWEELNVRTNAVATYHNADGELVIDLDGTSATAGARAWRELREEEARLLYVGITRAANRLYVYQTTYGEKKTSALSDLIGGERGVSAVFAELGKLASVRCQAGVGDVLPMAESNAGVAGELRARVFRGMILREAMTTSFTGLLRGAESAEEVTRETRHDPVVKEDAFPRGPHVGEFFHEVFAELDYTDATAVMPLVEKHGAVHGLPSRHFAQAAEWIAQTLRAPLPEGIRVNALRREQCRAEMDFTLRLPGLVPTMLREVFAEADRFPGFPEFIGRLQFMPVSGFLRGAIDLLFEHEGRFYILDWKSNWLGESAADYHDEAVQQAMRKHHYVLQAHLYALAADRFLAARVKGYDARKHFGGVFYLFFRGVTPELPGNGVFFDALDVSTIERMRSWI